MGSSKKQTVGYRYNLGMHQILIHGPADNMSRYVVDDRMAWRGLATGGQIYVSAETLFGGESREGGVSGVMDLEMGALTQGPNSYLQSHLGSDVPSFRGVVGIVQRQMYLGNNPYLKKNAFRLQRIHVRQDGVEQWYDEKAAIPRPGESGTLTGYFYVPAGTTQDTGSPGGTVTSDLVGTPWEIASQLVIIRNAAYIAAYGPGAQQVYITDAYFTGTTVVGIGNDQHEAYPPGTGVVSAETAMVCPEGGTPSSPDGDTVVCTLPGEYDMNPAHVVRECLTDPLWGMGYNEDDIDETSFVAAADQLYSEGMGISLLWDRQMPIEQFVQEVIKHINAALYVGRRGPEAGKFVLRLIRGDYDPGSLPQFDESNVEKVEGFKQVQEGELTNSVTVNYWDAITGKTASTTAQDPALIQQQGAVINTTMQYPGFTYHQIADRVALRDLTTLSTPLASCTLYTGPDAKDLNIGDVIAFSWEDYGLVGLPMRITAMTLGDGKSNKIKLTVTQDVFALPAQGVIVPPDVGWEDPNQEPVQMERHYAEEAPYFELVQQLSQSVVDTQLGTEPDMGIIAAAGSRPQVGALNARFMLDEGSGYEDVGAVDFCASAKLAAGVGRMDTALLLVEGVDLSAVELGTYAKVNSEYVVVVDIQGLSLLVKRGALDTIPQVHAADSVIFFSDPFIQLGPTEYVASDEIDSKLLTATGLGIASEALATADGVVFNSRAVRPYAPGNFKINGQYFPQWITTGDTVLTWSHRDRKQQTGGDIVAFPDGNVGPEAGQTYTVRVYDEDNNQIFEETNIAATNFTFTADMETGGGGTPPPDTALYDLVMSWTPFAYYRMADAAGLYQDISGNARHATAVGGTRQYQQPSLAFSTTNYSAYFQTDAYFQVTTFPLTLSAAHTMGCVLQITTGVDSTFVFHKGNFAVSGNQGATIQLNANGSVKLQYFNSGWRELTTAPGLIPYGPDPFTFVFRYNGGSGAGAAEIIVNGVKTAFGALPIALPNTSQPFQVGVSNQGSLVMPTDNTYIDEIFVVQAALSDATLAAFDALVREPVLLGDNGELTFELLSERDGYESWQIYSWTAKRQGYGFNYGEPYGAQAGFGLLYGQTYGV